MSSPRNSAHFVGELVAPRSWRETWIAVLGGYLDGSNLHGNVDVIAVAGCVANVKTWPAWEDKWNELLAVAGLERWHHTDFVAKRKTVNGLRTSWPEAEWLLCRKMLCDAFATTHPTCIGATVPRKDYEALRAKFPSLLPEDPYFFLLDRCMHRLIQGMFEIPKDEGVAVYCDQDKNEILVRDMAQWHTEYLRSGKKPGYPQQREITTTYGSNVQFVPLQAADVVAHELMRFARRHPGQPQIFKNVDTGSWILNRLNQECVWFDFCYKEEWLEWELDGRAWVPGSWPGYRFVAPES